MHNPQSIADWVLIHPQRHGPQMLWFLRYDRFVESIKAAQAIVRSA